MISNLKNEYLCSSYLRSNVLTPLIPLKMIAILLTERKTLFVTIKNLLNCPQTSNTTTQKYRKLQMAYRQTELFKGNLILSTELIA